MKEDSWKVRDDEKRVDSLEERGATCWIGVGGWGLFRLGS